MDLSEILHWLGGGGVMRPVVAGTSGDRLMDVADEEGGSVSLAPEPISSVAAVGPTIFAAWDA